MSVSDVLSLTNRLRLFVHAGPIAVAAGKKPEMQWVVARAAVGTARGVGASLAEAIADLEAQEAQSDVDELM